MGRLSKLIKTATVAAPVVVKLATTYGPELKRLYDNNPQAFEKVTSVVGGLGRGGKATGVKGAHKRIDDIRTQVTYLRDSADDAYERDRAKLWNSQLDRLSSALGLVDSMGAEARTAELARVNTRLDKLAGDVLAAYIEEQEEDARA